MEVSPKYENKSCPRCNSNFECKPGNITQCQCFEIFLTKAEQLFIQEIYTDCLCGNCLRELKLIHHEKIIFNYYSSLKTI